MKFFDFIFSFVKGNHHRPLEGYHVKDLIFELKYYRLCRDDVLGLYIDDSSLKKNRLMVMKKMKFTIKIASNGTITLITV